MTLQRVLERVRGEFLEMPGLRLTVAEAQRLCGVEATMCKAVLDALVDAKFLTVSASGVYARASDETVARSSRFKARSRDPKPRPSRS